MQISYIYFFFLLSKSPRVKLSDSSDFGEEYEDVSNFILQNDTYCQYYKYEIEEINENELLTSLSNDC